MFGLYFPRDTHILTVGRSMVISFRDVEMVQSHRPVSGPHHRYLTSINHATGRYREAASKTRIWSTSIQNEDTEHLYSRSDTGRLSIAG